LSHAGDRIFVGDRRVRLRNVVYCLFWFVLIARKFRFVRFTLTKHLRMDVAEQKNVSEPSAQCDESHDRNGDPSTRKSTTSDEIVKDLLNEVRSLEKPFSVEDLAAQKKEKDRKKKERKEHK
ncbi:hypothetical protein OESDEN_16719, partial [Oesophagostomum dentatum]